MTTSCISYLNISQMSRSIVLSADDKFTREEEDFCIDQHHQGPLRERSYPVSRVGLCGIFFSHVSAAFPLDGWVLVVYRSDVLLDSGDSHLRHQHCAACRCLHAAPKSHRLRTEEFHAQLCASWRWATLAREAAHSSRSEATQLAGIAFRVDVRARRRCFRCAKRRHSRRLSAADRLAERSPGQAAWPRSSHSDWICLAWPQSANCKRRRRFR